jgi:hypothetical protein
LEPSFPDMTGEFERVVEAARPRWFLRENVPKAPDCCPRGYETRSFLLDHSHLDAGDGTGHEQMRRRRFWFGRRQNDMTTEELAKGVPDLRRWIDFALFELPGTQAVAADSRAVPDRHGGSGKVKVTAVGGHDGHADALGDKAYRASRAAPVTGRHEGADGAPGKNYAPPPRSLEEMLRLQGLPADLFEHEGAKSPYTVQAKRKLVGNAVPYPMACALAEAVRKAVCE